MRSTHTVRHPLTQVLISSRDTLIHTHTHTHTHTHPEAMSNLAQPSPPLCLSMGPPSCPAFPRETHLCKLALQISSEESVLVGREAGRTVRLQRQDRSVWL
jgi:hypothetical protein